MGFSPAMPSLHDLPSLLVYLLFMLPAGALAALCCAVAAPLVKAPETKENLDVAMRTTGAATAALTITLAFCAVQARSTIGDAQRIVHQEAAALTSLARLAERLGPPGAPLLARTAQYVHAVAENEFPAMTAAGRHPGAQRHAEDLEHAAYALAATLSHSLAHDLLREADTVASLREDRLQLAAASLPQAFWVLIALLSAVVLATGTLYPPRPHVLAMLGLQATALGGLVGFVFLIEQPFRGEAHVSARPYLMLAEGLAHHAAPLRLSHAP